MTKRSRFAEQAQQEQAAAQAAAVLVTGPWVSMGMQVWGGMGSQCGWCAICVARWMGMGEAMMEDATLSRTA